MRVITVTGSDYCVLSVGSKINIDGDSTATGVITGILIRMSHHVYEVSWMANGDSKIAWFEDWRITEFSQ